MKKQVLIFSIFIICLFVSQAQEVCDILKWKVIETYYGELHSNDYFYKIDYLDGAIINIDTLPYFFPCITAINVSNDTFYANEDFTILATIEFYADTGRIGSTGWINSSYFFGADFFPNDTLRTRVLIKADLLPIINSIKEATGIELEQISSWKMIISIDRTSKDGYYSDSVFFAGADTSTFRVVRGGVSIAETDNYPSLRVYPNPTTGQLTIENGELTMHNVEIYNVVGQKQEIIVNCPLSTVNSIDVSHLPAGMYFLRISDKVVKFMKE